MKVEVSRDLMANDLTERLRKGGLGFIGRNGEYTLVRRDEYPDQFPPKPLSLTTRETQDLSP